LSSLSTYKKQEDSEFFAVVNAVANETGKTFAFMRDDFMRAGDNIVVGTNSVLVTISVVGVTFVNVPLFAVRGDSKAKQDIGLDRLVAGAHFLPRDGMHHQRTTPSSVSLHGVTQPLVFIL
jgi:hypothetical protein